MEFSDEICVCAKLVIDVQTLRADLDNPAVGETVRRFLFFLSHIRRLILARQVCVQCQAALSEGSIRGVVLCAGRVHAAATTQHTSRIYYYMRRPNYGAGVCNLNVIVCYGN